MRIEKRRFDDVVILTFIGELDEASRQGAFEKIDTIIESGYTRLVFNLRFLKFINSTALGSLNKTRQQVAELGGDLVLVQPSRFVKKVLVTVGFDTLFRIFEDDLEAVRYFHTGVGASVDLKSLPRETDETLTGAGAILFRVLGVRPEGPPTKGAIHSVGQIVSLHKEGPVFRWRIPAPGSEGAAGGVSTESFDQKIHEGTKLAIKFRQQFAVRRHFFRGEARVTSVTKQMEEGGVEEATLHLEYTSLEPGDREILDRYVDDLDEFRGEVL